MLFFNIFASPRWSPLRMRTKVVSFFIFFQELSKKIKALRPKMTKIASRGSCLNFVAWVCLFHFVRSTSCFVCLPSFLLSLRLVPLFCFVIFRCYVVAMPSAAEHQHSTYCIVCESNCDVVWCKPARLTTFLNWRHFGLHWRISLTLVWLKKSLPWLASVTLPSISIVHTHYLTVTSLRCA